MHLLGHHLADHKPVRVALCSFYGISHHISSRLMARLQINSKCLVNQLTEPQITSLSAYLSSPTTTPRPPRTPLAVPGSSLGIGSKISSSLETIMHKGKGRALEVETAADPLDDLKIETELRKEFAGDIAHQRQVGSYRGRRMAVGLPIRGQRTKTNAQTAKRLNRGMAKAYSTSAGPMLSREAGGSRILSMVRSWVW